MQNIGRFFRFAPPSAADKVKFFMRQFLQIFHDTVSRDTPAYGIMVSKQKIFYIHICVKLPDVVFFAKNIKKSRFFYQKPPIFSEKTKNTNSRPLSPAAA